MKAAVIRAYGGPDVLRLEDVPDPSLGVGDLLVRVAAASINPVDTYERAGKTKDYRPVTFPWDSRVGRLSGTVVSTGPEARGFAPGDRVFAWGYHTYAELWAVDARVVAKVPTALDLEEAAAASTRRNDREPAHFGRQRGRERTDGPRVGRRRRGRSVRDLHG